MNIFSKYRTARSLCAVFLAIALLFFSPAFFIQAQEDEATIDPDSGETYIYAIEIEFGSLGFYYDWGNWNVNTFSYEADPTSIHPAEDTTAGFPGWYGFDGIANKITVTNLTPSGLANQVKVSLRYNDVSDRHSVISLPLMPGCVAMYCYDTPTFSGCLNASNDSGYIPNECEFMMEGGGISREIYISFSGEPRTPEGQLFISESIRQIGYITLGVSLDEE